VKECDADFLDFSFHVKFCNKLCSFQQVQ